MKTTLHMLITLICVGLFSGGALSLVNQATAPRIAELERLAKEAAVLADFPAEGKSSEPVIPDRAARIAAGEDPATLPEAYRVFNEAGEAIGYAILGVGLGFQDDIKLMVGVSMDLAQVRGLFVISDSETPGLGTKIRPGQTWPQQFFGIGDGRYLATQPPLKVVKGARSADNEVEAITAATISSMAVTDIVNAAVASLRTYLAANPPGGVS